MIYTRWWQTQKVARPRQTGHVQELDMPQLCSVNIERLGCATTVPAAVSWWYRSQSFCSLAALAAAVAALA